MRPLKKTRFIFVNKNKKKYSFHLFLLLNKYKNTIIKNFKI